MSNLKFLYTFVTHFSSSSLVRYTLRELKLILNTLTVEGIVRDVCSSRPSLSIKLKSNVPAAIRLSIGNTGQDNVLFRIVLLENGDRRWTRDGSRLFKVLDISVENIFENRWIPSVEPILRYALGSLVIAVEAYCNKGWMKWKIEENRAAGRKEKGGILFKSTPSRSW